jgi:hypothetical protein
MKNSVKIGIISGLVIGMVLISGCTSQDNNKESPTVTPAGGSPTITPAGGSCNNYIQFEKQFEKIVTPLIPLTKKSQLNEISSNTNFHGKFLLWDVASNSIGGSCYFNLKYQAIPDDKIITVFFITERNYKSCGLYSEVNGGWRKGRVFSEEVTIVAIEYPSQKVIGKKVIPGYCPDHYTQYGNNQDFNISAFTNVYDWTRSLISNIT